MKQKEILKQIEKEIDSFVPKINCEVCGKEEVKISSRHKFCRDCSLKVKKLKYGKYNSQSYLKNLYENGNKLLVIVKCRNCGNKYDEIDCATEDISLCKWCSGEDK